MGGLQKREIVFNTCSHQFCVTQAHANRMCEIVIHSESQGHGQHCAKSFITFKDNIGGLSPGRFNGQLE